MWHIRLLLPRIFTRLFVRTVFGLETDRETSSPSNGPVLGQDQENWTMSNLTSICRTDISECFRFTGFSLNTEMSQRGRPEGSAGCPNVAASVVGGDRVLAVLKTLGTVVSSIHVPGGSRLFGGGISDDQRRSLFRDVLEFLQNIFAGIAVEKERRNEKEGGRCAAEIHNTKQTDCADTVWVRFSDVADLQTM